MMTIAKEKLYLEFLDAFLKANPSLKKQTAYSEAQKSWNKIKFDETKVKGELTKLKSKPGQQTLAQCFLKQTELSESSKEIIVTEVNVAEMQNSSPVVIENERSQSDNPSSPERVQSDKSFTSKCETHAQDKLSNRINEIVHRLAYFYQLKNCGQLTTDEGKMMKQLIDEKYKLQLRSNKLKRDMLIAKGIRLNKKCAIDLAMQEDANLQKKLKKSHRKEPGRPSLEEDQPELLNAIVDLVRIGASADSCRRTETLESCLMLDDLAEKLKLLGFTLSRSALYLWLLPARSTTLEGKRHVATVPVKLIRAQNTARKTHSDQQFASSVVKYMKNLAVQLGSQNCLFLSQDDKVRVLLGLPAVQKQSRILMHMEDMIKLPDHDWVVAKGHKLIPSVYAACLINDSLECVTCSGPTFISICSAKHDSSTAATHVADFDTLAALNEFVNCILTLNNLVKPIVFITVDGGPDENPRYLKTLASAIYLFDKYDLDAIFMATNAPGHSAYNAVER